MRTLKWLYICIKKQTKTIIMKTLQTTNRTFNKSVKRLIVANLDKVSGFKKVDHKCVRLIGKEGKTVALWNQTANGSEVALNSWY
jgi:D-arabinose 5-phosphate isomerase GutQ